MVFEELLDYFKSGVVGLLVSDVVESAEELARELRHDRVRLRMDFKSPAFVLPRHVSSAERVYFTASQAPTLN